MTALKRNLAEAQIRDRPREVRERFVEAALRAGAHDRARIRATLRKRPGDAHQIVVKAQIGNWIYLMSDKTAQVAAQQLMAATRYRRCEHLSQTALEICKEIGEARGALAYALRGVN